MGAIVLITGGGRSGKSSYGQRLAENLPGPRAYVATAVPFDQELEERVRRHREERSDTWSTTIEEPVALAAALRSATQYPTVLVDCLTMWMGNLLWSAEQSQGPAPNEAQVADACSEVVAACREHAGTVVLVTNEVGMGIIPENPAARLYRDLLGRCNQVMAAAADTVILMVAGLPLVVKGREP
jgi:adenosylcobinamide kinase/adenosylcobinamide-phosphate guanylyltransferase